MAEAPGRLSAVTILAFATTAIPTAAMALIIGVYMPRFYAGHVGVTFLAVSAMMTLVRLIDIPFDPFIGGVMDHSRTPIGRYRFWMILGAPLLGASVYMLLNPPEGADQTYLLLWLLAYFAGVSIFTLAHAAWAATLASNYNERSRIFGWMAGVGVIGAVGLTGLPLLTSGNIDPGSAASMPLISWILIGALAVTTAIVVFFSPERIVPRPASQKFRFKDYWDAISRPNMARIIGADLLISLGTSTTGPIFIAFFHDAKDFPVPVISTLLIPYIGAGLVGAPVWAQIARAVGKHRTLQLAALAYAVAQTTLMVLPAGMANFWPTFAGMFGVGFCASAFVPIMRAMVADVADEVRLEQKRERFSLMFAMVTSTQKVGAAISVSIIGVILAFVGYDMNEHVTNSPDAVFGLQMAYLFAPIILVFLGAFTLFGYSLDHNRHAEIRQQLDVIDAEAAASTEH